MAAPAKLIKAQALAIPNRLYVDLSLAVDGVGTRADPLGRGSRTVTEDTCFVVFGRAETVRGNTSTFRAEVSTADVSIGMLGIHEVHPDATEAPWLLSDGHIPATWTKVAGYTNIYSADITAYRAGFDVTKAAPQPCKCVLDEAGLFTDFTRSNTDLDTNIDRSLPLYRDTWQDLTGTPLDDELALLDDAEGESRSLFVGNGTTGTHTVYIHWPSARTDTPNDAGSEVTVLLADNAIGSSNDASYSLFQNSGRAVRLCVSGLRLGVAGMPADGARLGARFAEIQTTGGNTSVVLDHVEARLNAATDGLAVLLQNSGEIHLYVEGDGFTAIRCASELGALGTAFVNATGVGSTTFEAADGALWACGDVGLRTLTGAAYDAVSGRPAAISYMHTGRIAPHAGSCIQWTNPTLRGVEIQISSGDSVTWTTAVPDRTAFDSFVEGGTFENVESLVSGNIRISNPTIRVTPDYANAFLRNPDRVLVENAVIVADRGTNNGGVWGFVETITTNGNSRKWALDQVSLYGTSTSGNPPYVVLHNNVNTASVVANAPTFHIRNSTLFGTGTKAMLCWAGANNLHTTVCGFDGTTTAVTGRAPQGEFNGWLWGDSGYDGRRHPVPQGTNANDGLAGVITLHETDPAGWRTDEPSLVDSDIIEPPTDWRDQDPQEASPTGTVYGGLQRNFTAFGAWGVEPPPPPPPPRSTNVGGSTRASYAATTPRRVSLGPTLLLRAATTEDAAWGWSADGAPYVGMADMDTSRLGLIDVRGYRGLRVEFFGEGDNDGAFAAHIYAAWQHWPSRGTRPSDNGQIHYRRLGIAIGALGSSAGTAGSAIDGSRYADTLIVSPAELDDHFGALHARNLRDAAESGPRGAMQVIQAGTPDGSPAGFVMATHGMSHVRVLPFVSTGTTNINALVWRLT